MRQLGAREKLVLATLIGAMIWLGLLPRLARWEPIRARIEANEAAGIDPSAMYYSDLEHMSFRDGMLRRTP